MYWFVSRHAGAIEWAKRQSLNVDCYIEHLCLEDIQPGDVVYGTLPVHLAFGVCQKQARYIHLVLNLPVGLRGKELSPQQLLQVEAQLQEFVITTPQVNYM